MKIKQMGMVLFSLPIVFPLLAGAFPKEQKSPNAVELTSVRIAMGNWLPFNGHRDGRSGYIVDVLREIFDDAGIRSEFVILPFTRAKRDTEDGFYNGMLNTSEGFSSKLKTGTQEVGVVEYCYFTRAGDDWEYTGTPSLHGRSIVFNTGHPMHDDKSFYENPDNKKYFIHIPYTETYLDQVIEMMNSGHLDTFVEERHVVKYYLRKHPESKVQIRKAGYLRRRKLYMGFPVAPELAEKTRIIDTIVSQGLLRLRDSGRLTRIMNSYDLEVWEKEDIR